jgi:hypothetical protein
MARFVYGLACIQLILVGSTLLDESTPGLAALWIRKAGGTLTSCTSIFTAYCIKTVGTPEMVHADLHAFIKQSGADELMIACDRRDPLIDAVQLVAAQVFGRGSLNATITGLKFLFEATLR